CGTASCATCRRARCTAGKSTGSCLLSTAPWFGPTSRRRGRRKKNRPVGEPDDHALGRSQGGFGTKLHLICDGEGTPMAVTVSPGQEHETQQFVPLLEEATAWREQPEKVAGDKGYSADWIRDWLQERGIKAVIPYKSNEKGRKKRFDRTSYRRRNIIERNLPVGVHGFGVTPSSMVSLSKASRLRAGRRSRSSPALRLFS